MKAQLSPKQKDVLDSLASYGGRKREWARPMDIGARDGSHHSATLTGLVKHGLVARKKYHAIYCHNGSTYRQKLVDGRRWVTTSGHLPSTACNCKGSCRYRLTLRGWKVARP